MPGAGPAWHALHLFLSQHLIALHCSTCFCSWGAALLAWRQSNTSLDLSLILIQEAAASLQNISPV